MIPDHPLKNPTSSRHFAPKNWEKKTFFSPTPNDIYDRYLGGSPTPIIIVFPKETNRNARKRLKIRDVTTHRKNANKNGHPPTIKKTASSNGKKLTQYPRNPAGKSAHTTRPRSKSSLSLILGLAKRSAARSTHPEECRRVRCSADVRQQQQPRLSPPSTTLRRRVSARGMSIDTQRRFLLNRLFFMRTRALREGGMHAHALLDGFLLLFFFRSFAFVSMVMKWDGFLAKEFSGESIGAAMSDWFYFFFFPVIWAMKSSKAYRIRRCSHRFYEY